MMPASGPFSDVLRLCLLVLGIVLIIVSPLVGLVPGPGGLIVFALGLALVLRTSLWARRNYVRLKRRWPRLGRVADKGLGRRRKQRHHKRGGN